MPSLFIDGQWVASGRRRTCSPVVNPSDAIVVTEVDVATDDQVQAAIARRAPRLRRDRLAADADRRPGGAARSGRRADRPRPRGDGPARDANTGKAMRESRWDMSDVARVFRYYADLADKEAGRLVDTGRPERPEPDRLRAGRRVRADRAVELPAPPDELEDRAGAGRRNTAVMKPASYTPLTDDPPDPPARGGRRHRRGVVNLVLGPGRARRPGAGRQPRRRPHLADRRARRRPGAAARRGGQRQAGRPRARRQEPEHRLRRRRLRDGRRQRPDRGLRPFRPGLLGGLPGDRPGRDLRPRSSPRSAGAPTGSGSGIGMRRRDRGRRAHHAPSHRAKVEGFVASAARRGRPAGGRRPAPRRARAPGRLLLPADGLRRRHAATCGSSARRSSGRS